MQIASKPHFVRKMNSTGHSIYSGWRSKIPNDIILLSLYKYVCQRRPILLGRKDEVNGCICIFYANKSSVIYYYHVDTDNTIADSTFSVQFKLLPLYIYFSLLPVRCVPSLASSRHIQTELQKKSEKKNDDCFDQSVGIFQTTKARISHEPRWVEREKWQREQGTCEIKIGKWKSLRIHLKTLQQPFN